MYVRNRSKRLLIIGIIGCILYVIGDFLFAVTGKGQTTESIGFMLRVACLDMGTWRMVASILCGFVGTLLYYMGFHRMYGLLRLHVTAEKDLKWVKLFRVAYVTGTVAWAYVHAMFMNVALIFKYVYQSCGDMQRAADVASRVFGANAAPMLIAYILCDLGLTVVMIVMVWKNIIPLKSTPARILATLCNPMAMPGIVGNLLALLPWPVNQLDHGTESFGHALVLILGLILLREMSRAGELENAEALGGGIGMNDTPDWPRIQHLLRLGILASLMVLTGDMLLGWGVIDPSVTDLPALFTRYLSVSDGRIIASALLGLIGIPFECLCWFAVYRMIKPCSEKDAHAYRAGIIGCLVFGGCGVHVPCCMAVWLLKHFYTDDPATAMQGMLRFIGWFLLPATVIFLVFFLLAAIVQIRAFAKGHTPLSRRCWVFSVLFGFVFAVVMRLIGNYGLTNALATGWISIGNLWMMSGLLSASRKVGK